MVIANPMESVALRTDADGVIRVGGTRVTLDTVIEAFHEGLTLEEIVAQYPSLKLDDVYSVILYYLRHQAEVAEYLKEAAQRSAAVREEVERRFNPVGIRERLMARCRREEK